MVKTWVWYSVVTQGTHATAAYARRPQPPPPQAWKRRVGALEDGRDAGAIVPSDPGAELEILLDRQLRKDVLPLGDVADAEPLDRVGRESLDLPPAVEDPATPRMEEAEDRLQQRRLAGAVRADDAGDAARLDPERDVRQDIDALDVAGRDVVDLQERHLPAP